MHNKLWAIRGLQTVQSHRNGSVVESETPQHLATALCSCVGGQWDGTRLIHLWLCRAQHFATSFKPSQHSHPPASWGAHASLADSLAPATRWKVKSMPPSITRPLNRYVFHLGFHIFNRLCPMIFLFHLFNFHSQMLRELTLQSEFLHSLRYWISPSGRQRTQ